MADDQLDPELAPLLERMRTRPFSAETLTEDRAWMQAMWAGYQRPTDDGVTREERFVPGAAGDPDVKVIIYRPEAGLRVPGAVLHIHGGGFIAGDAANTEAWNRLQVAELGCLVVSVNYRKAPETKFPGPQEDCYAALLWLHASAAELGIDPARIVVEGVSAGGALAASTCLIARDRGGPAIALQALVYPMLDDRVAVKGPRYPHLGKHAWFYDSNAFGWTSMLGADKVGGEDVHYHAAPARCPDLAGLPPTIIGAAGLDMLVLENLDYARRLIEAAVPTQINVYPRVFHGFDVADNRASRAFKRDRLDAMRRAMEGPA